MAAGYVIAQIRVTDAETYPRYVAMVQPIVEKYETSPTFTSIDETNYHISNIEFPAVTICSNNKIVEKQLKWALGKHP